MVALNPSNEIHITRVYEASLKAVWDAWTDPEQVAQWWGPRGFTLTTHAKDLRPGGIWHYTMHGPDGIDYPNKTLYHEVEECSRLVYDHGGYDDRPPMFRVTVLFAHSDGRTTMDMTMTLPTAEEAEAARKFIKAAGGNATWDRLAEYLDEKDNGRSSFVINRSFNAPIEQLFEMWIDPVHLSHWMPPVGFEMEFQRAEIGEGNSCFYRMSDSEGATLYGRNEYLEINKPSRLAYVQRFCDENEAIARHPGLPVFPEALLVTVTFTSESEQVTRVTVTSEPYGTVSPEETSAFINLRKSMTQGWSGSFDKLETMAAQHADAV